MKLGQQLPWLLQNGRAKAIFDNLRNFLICGTLAYLAIHLILVAGSGWLGLLDRIFSWTALILALGLMALNIADGFVRIRDHLGRAVSVVVTMLYILMALYIVFALATTKMHAAKAIEKASSQIPFLLF